MNGIAAVIADRTVTIESTRNSGLEVGLNCSHQRLWYALGDINLSFLT